jgi:predicted ATPase
MPVTGMSGTGKATLPHELAARGHRNVDVLTQGSARGALGVDVRRRPG